MATLRTEWPSTPVPEPIKNLIGQFYALGDQKSEDAGRRLGEEVFAPTGQILVNKRTITGTEEISTSNHGMLQGLQSRQHKVSKIYTCSEAADDLMLFGTVTWVLNNGHTVDAGFSARIVVEGGHSDNPKIKLFHGFADLSELRATLTQQQ